jgi:FkbM family methyltransferase
MERRKIEVEFTPRVMDTLVGAIRNRIFRSVTKRPLKFFFRGGDLISVNPLTNGSHEPGFTHVISHFCASGYDGFLIDIGANIGLTSCQNGNSFAKVICFEPNPLCVHILKVNTEIGIANSSVEINEYGLGSKAGIHELWVPKHNWGGAFVRSDQNSYSDEILALKDSFSSVDKANYSVKSIEIRSAEEVLTEKLTELVGLGLTSGVVKIDVEGMEMDVILGLARALPALCDIVIVFENWDTNFDFGVMENAFTGRLTETYIFRSAITVDRIAKPPSLLRQVRQKFSKYSLSPIESVSNRIGDVIFIVN